MPLTSAGLTRLLYVDVLRALLPVLRSWEAWAAAVAPPSLQPLLPPRRRSHLLAADLQALGVSTSEPDQPAFQPVNWPKTVMGEDQSKNATPSSHGFEAAFLGTFYVLEGSTLGGRFIARHVETALGLEPGVGDAYFRGHGDATGALWRETTAAIAAVPEEHAPLLIGAARRTFRAFGAVLEQMPSKVSAP